MYNYDPEAIFQKLIERDLSGGEDFLDEFAYKKWIWSVLAPKGRVRFSTEFHKIKAKLALKFISCIVS